MRASPLALAWLIAFSLRAGLLAVSPALPSLQADLHLLHAESQTIFALPVIVMGLLAIPGGLLTDRFGTWWVVLGGLALVFVAASLRAVAGGYAPLALLTVGFGAGVGIVQPALPKLIRERYAGRVQTATGVYTSGFAAGGALGGWLTAAYLLRLAGGWRGTFLIWGLFVALPLLLWALLADRGPAAGASRRAAAERPAAAPRAPAWRLPGIGVTSALGMAQAIAFYTMTAWLPTYLHELGDSPGQIAVVFGVYQALTIPASILAPWLMERFGNRRAFMTATACVYLAGTLGFVLAPLSHPLLWALMVGTCNAPPFVMSMALPAELAPRERVAGATGIVLTASYGGAVLMGVDYAVLFPTAMLSVGKHPEAGVETGLCDAYAHWMTECVLPSEEGVITMLPLPFNDEDASLQMIERYGACRGVVGFMVTSVRQQPVHHKKYMKVYAALQERGLPLGFHAATEWEHPSQVTFNRFIGVHTLGFPLFNIVHLINLVVNGIPERFPRLKIVWIEAGVAWIPFLMQRLDNEYMMRSSEAPLLRRKPSEYMREFFYTSQPLEQSNMRFLEAQFELIGAETQLLYASDYPHWDFDLPATIYDLPFLSERAKRRILGENALELFRLPVPERYRAAAGGDAAPSAEAGADGADRGIDGAGRGSDRAGRGMDAAGPGVPSPAAGS